MFYESLHSGFDGECSIHLARGMNFPKHIHRSYELILSLNDGMVAEIDGNVYELNANEAVMVFSHQRHAYKAKPSNTSVMIIFSPDMVPSFHKTVNGYLPENPVFAVSEAFSAAFPTMTDVKQVSQNNNIFLYKSFIYGIADQMLTSCTLIKKKSDSKESLLEKMLGLIDESLVENDSLMVLAEKLNYDYTYLSKYFLKESGMSFTRYINECRIQLACQYLQDDKECGSITEIALKSGYSSIRSFNDNFRKCTGITPKQYAKKSGETLSAR